mmetsp:Transcript_19690/g.31492  ORF Transcript_19690/g.31492 Transcript_19690/m.31492 type:complete len:209 (+) Transcript_19690:158-784(+)
MCGRPYVAISLGMGRNTVLCHHTAHAAWVQYHKYKLERGWNGSSRGHLIENSQSTKPSGNMPGCQDPMLKSACKRIRTGSACLHPIPLGSSSGCTADITIDLTLILDFVFNPPCRRKSAMNYGTSAWQTSHCKRVFRHDGRTAVNNCSKLGPTGSQGPGICTSPAQIDVSLATDLVATGLTAKRGRHYPRCHANPYCVPCVIWVGCHM